MNIGKKMRILYDSIDCKNWQEFGKFVDINGDWCLDISKREEIDMVSINRLFKICNKFGVSIDWFLSENEFSTIGIQQGFPDDDVGTMLDKIIIQTSDSSKYYGTTLKKEGSQLVIDALNEVKRLIQDNL